MERTRGERIETERLTLRAPTTRDAARLTALVNDVAVARMLSQVPHPYFIDDARDYLAQVDAENPRRDRTFALEHREAGLVGFLGFHTVEDPWPELGYWLGREYWGRGLASEAAVAAMAWAANGWRKRAIGSGHFVDNPASGRVLVKAGLLYTGERRRRASFARMVEVETRMMIWLA